MDEARPRKRGHPKGVAVSRSAAYMSRSVAEACLTCPYARCIAGGDGGCRRYKDAVREELTRRRRKR